MHGTTTPDEHGAIRFARHLRGGFGEATLERLLADFLPLGSFELQYMVDPHSTERVDAIVKLAKQVLPIDSKFPREQVLPLFETHDPELLEGARKALATYVSTQAKSIAKKYIRPEHGTTDMALFVAIQPHGAPTIDRVRELGRSLSVPKAGDYIDAILRKIIEDEASPKLSKATSAELAQTLSHPDGWWRDTAQRLLVERSDPKVVPALEKIIGGETKQVTSLGKIHALWTLAGMERLEDEVVAAALKDADATVRVQALRAGELLIRKRTGNATMAALPALAKDADLAVQLQVLSLAVPENVELQTAANTILAHHLTDPIFRAASLSAAAGRELELLQSLLTDKSFTKAPDTDKKSLFNDLAECVVRGRSAERIEKLFDLIAAQPAAAKADRIAMLSGVSEAVTPDSKSKAPRRMLRVLRKPPGLIQLAADKDKKIADMAGKIEDAFSWPNKPGDKTPPLKPLSGEQAKRFEAGRELFTQLCAVCHQPSGMGMEGVAPPLVDSDWILGTPERNVRIVLNGLTGQVKIGKKTFESEMPGLKVLDDEQIASVLTYIRREWGHEAGPIEPAVVAKIRKETAGRGDQQWTADELSKLK